MSITPGSGIGGLVGGTSKIGEDISKYRNAVTVFGFPVEASSYILSLFRNFGSIKSYQHVGNGNWINIEFENEMQAEAALSKSGMIVGGDVMIGVIRMKKVTDARCSRDLFWEPT
jgi:hypothetical protein